MNGLTKRSAFAISRTLTGVNQASIRLSHDEVKPRRWARWQDVPDDWVLKNPRAPDRLIYTHPRYRNLKKQQIFYQQEDGLPTYLKHGWPHNLLYVVIAIGLVYSGYGAITQMLDGHIYPKKRKD